MSNLKLSLRLAVVTTMLAIIPYEAQARVHTWIPIKTAQGAPVQQVVITGSKINWGAGYFDDAAFNEFMSFSSASSMFGPFNAAMHAAERALELSDVCQNPLVSEFTKATTGGGSDITGRWLAANDTFNSLQISRAIHHIYRAQGAIQIIVDNKAYSGFKITYADGASEVWLVNPGWATSSVKVLDTPAPGSLKLPKTPKAGCSGKG